MMGGADGDEYVWGFAASGPPDIFGGRRPPREGMNGVEPDGCPAAASAPVRSIATAPERCAALQFRPASSVVPAKNAKRAPSKLSSSSARIKVGSPAASVKVPGGTRVSNRTISLEGKWRSSRTWTSSLPRKDEAPTTATREEFERPEGMI